MNTVLLTMLALLAFAGNSVLCRLALGDGAIDASGFTIIRLLSGATTLALILFLTPSSRNRESKGSWRSSILLFVYAVSFSFAYVSLGTGTGALILFAAVQITMLLYGALSGAKLHTIEWFGVVAAFLGFTYLVSPGVAAPSVEGFILMSVAGVAWGFYTLAGKGSKDPLSDTCYNFIRTLPFVLVLLLATYNRLSLSQSGLVLAILSGAVASGMGYTIWYIALKGLSSTQAAVVQLLVPLIAALGGILFTNEALTTRFIAASVIILGGILTVIKGRQLVAPKMENP